jgi:membrane dipeptidase
MNEMGMIIDVSHVHESTFWAAIKKSKKPIIASHSNSAGLCPIPRNLKDDQIKAIADTGGIVGINFYPGFLNKKYEKEQKKRCGDLFLMLQDIEKDLWKDPVKRQEAMGELGSELNARMVDLHVGIESIVDHIEYMVKLVGDDHVGFGSDFDGLPALPSGVSGCDIFPSITGLMEARGFNENAIKKICSENFIRVFEANE